MPQIFTIEYQVPIMKSAFSTSTIFSCYIFLQCSSTPFTSVTAADAYTAFKLQKNNIL